MIYNYFFPGFPFYPGFPTDNEKPPTLYAILNSIVNFGKSEKTKIKDLASVGRTSIFDFEYPLTNNVDKAKFETTILNHFLMRRIGFETVTAFQIQLNVKLNSIMPLYNKMFDALEGWDLFNSGEKVERNVNDTRNIDTLGSTKNTSTNTTTNSLENNSTTNNTTTEDHRESELPQSEIENVQNASYLTKYNLNKNTSENIDNSTSSGSSKSETSDNTNTNNSSKENGNLKEEILRTPADKISIFKEFQTNVQSIYNLIFKDLEDLFYGLI